MSEEVKNRSLFALNGITGLLIAVVLLLTIEIALVTTGLFIQQDNATNYYDINKAALKKIDAANAQHMINKGQ